MSLVNALHTTHQFFSFDVDVDHFTTNQIPIVESPILAVWNGNKMFRMNCTLEKKIAQEPWRIEDKNRNYLNTQISHVSKVSAAICSQNTDDKTVKCTLLDLTD